MDKDPTMPILHTQATINVDDSWPIEGASIVLSGVWWKGYLLINEHRSEYFYGGNQQVELSIGQYLHHGANTIQLHIEAPTGISRKVTGGTLSSLDREGKNATITLPPKFIFRPKDHLSNMDLLLDGDMVTPIAWAQTDSDATVHFYLSQDANILQDLGTCSIQQGMSHCAAIPWKQEKWTIGKPALYLVHAVLETPEGKALDHATKRMGVREATWTTNGATINDIPQTLLASRMVHRTQQVSFTERMQLFASVGINTVEIHGELLRQDWLDLADELGIATVIMPRCVGRTNGKMGGSENDLEAFANLQDHRLLWDTMGHPSVTAFVVEGDNSNSTQHRLWTSLLQQNIHKLSILGVDVPAQLFQVQYNPQASSSCKPNSCTSAWLIETVMSPQFVDWDSVAQEYAKQQQAGSIGGVIPIPRSQRLNSIEAEIADWTKAWQEVRPLIQPTPLQTSDIRASSTLHIKTNPHAMVSITIPSYQRFAQRADGSGNAHFSLYYAGPVEITCDKQTISVQLEADTWNNFTHIENNKSIDCRN